MSHTITGAEPKETKTFFGHPRMLANLFTVEMWERFSFYGMQGIMIYYLYYTADKGGLGLDQALATGVIGAYGAVVYLMAILGGIFGDRLLGPERTLFYSAIGIMAGHISLSLIPGIPGVVIGLLLVFVYSLFQYRLLGFVTIASLIVAGIISYEAIALLGWALNYRLSLAGVAGVGVGGEKTLSPPAPPISSRRRFCWTAR